MVRAKAGDGCRALDTQAPVTARGGSGCGPSREMDRVGHASAQGPQSAVAESLGLIPAPARITTEHFGGPVR